MSETLAERLARVRACIEAARTRGRGDAVTLVGVGKRQPAAALREARVAGLLDFGENYAQELRQKAHELVDLELRWHFVGALQSNKVKQVLAVAPTLIHTVDRDSLLQEIDKRARALGRVQPVLVEVNLGEQQKAGVTIERVPALLDAFAGTSHVRCAGLMAIPPEGTPEQTRPHFRRLRELRDSLAATARPHVDLRELSMGMSADFEVAIEEGATLVRVGTAIFGARA